jgi:NAD(P)H dehydrogenase (quinone)
LKRFSTQQKKSFHGARKGSRSRSNWSNWKATHSELVEKQVSVRVTARNPKQLPELKAQFGDAVQMDLDDPRTFPQALQGVQRAFLLTGYTVGMITQGKTFIDAAKKAGVKHVVHLGVFTPRWDCTDPHFVWHQLLESYLRESQLNWTNLHPNCFMQNLIGSYGLLRGSTLNWYTEKPCGWIALEDVAEASAKILEEGPHKHHGKDYWFSTDSLTASQMAAILTQQTGKTI